MAVSRAVAADLSATSAHFVPHVVLNGVDLDEFTPDAPALDLDLLAGVLPVQPGTVRIGIVGTTGRFKGQDIFLRAVALLSRAVPVRAYVIGGPVYVTGSSQVSLSELKGLAAELGIADRSAFTGFVHDVAGAMRSLDVVVHATTRPEPFGLVIAEAMACGRAVIASESGGALEIVEAGVTALTHAPGDVQALAAALGRLVSDVGLRDRLAAAALRYARIRFDRTRLAAEMLPIYGEALVHRRDRAG